MSVNIYNPQGSVILAVVPSDDSTRVRRIRSENYVLMNYSLPEYIEIPVGSYTDYRGQRYTLWRPEDFTKQGSRIWNYAVKFGSSQEYLKTQKYKLLSAIPYELKFVITAKPSVLIQILVDNLNVNDSGWEVGEVIEATEKVLSFNYDWCYDALQRIADEFNTEWEIVGKTVHLRKVERFKDNPVPLKYGKGNGLLPGIERKVKNDKSPVTVLYVQGGERNINFADYGSKTLRLPSNQTLQYEGRTYLTDEHGMFITRADRPLTVHNEDGYDASHIYPSRVGEVTEVVVLEAEKEDEVDVYDIIDSTIPDDLDFNDCRIPGEKATIIFQSGVLTGREFDIEQTKDALTGYVHAERRFRLVPLEEYGSTYPNANAKPAIGNKYAVFHISLPQAYVCDNISRTGASWDMFREAVRYMYENEDERFSISGDMSALFAKSRWEEIGTRIVPGGYVSFSDDDFQQEPVLIRITGITEYINNPHNPRLELSNVPVAGGLGASLGKLEAGEVITRAAQKESNRYAKRSFDAALELGDALERKFKNFSEGISPIYVRAMQGLFGDAMSQVEFVNQKIDPVARVDHPFYYDQATRVFSTPAGILRHQTLGISDMAPSHSADEYHYWDMNSFASYPVEEDGGLWLYARCSKTDQTGVFMLGGDDLDSDETYYYFVLGRLSPELNGERSFVPLFSFTEILPGMIITSVMRDALARLIIDLANARITAKDGAEIIGKIIFSAGSSGYDNIVDKPDISGAIDTASQNLFTYIDGAFADGIIDETEALNIQLYLNVLAAEKANLDAAYTVLYDNPLLTGAPKTNLYNAKSSLDAYYVNIVSYINTSIADGKITDAEKAGVDSRYANYRAALGIYSTRYEEAHSLISSSLNQKSTSALTAAENASNAANVANTNATNAQNAANTAASTANSKARVFYSVAAPTSGMQTNDLWVNGSLIYRYNGASWVQADKYDVQMTIVNGGLVSTGAIIFGSTGGMAATGSVRFWCGGSNNVAGSGTYRIMDNGDSYSKGAYMVENANGNVLAGITGEGSSDTSVRFWGGASYGNRASAPWHVTQGGFMRAEKGQIGNFTIENGWLKTNSNISGSDVGYIDMRSPNTRVAFGRDLVPGTVGGYITCTALITNNRVAENGGESIGLEVTASGNDTTHNSALILNGGLRMAGKVSIAEEYALNVGVSNSSGSTATNLRYYRTFMYQPDSGGANTYLPTSDAIQSTFGWLSSGKGAGYGVVIEIRIIVTRWAEGLLRIHGSSGTPILDNDGNTKSYIDMRKGDVLMLFYFNGAWYTGPANFM